MLTEVEVFDPCALKTSDDFKFLGTLASCPRLKVAKLTLCALPALPPQLEELKFSSYLTEHILSISALTNLRRLHLDECEALVDLTPIQACTALESLKVIECIEVVRWPDLGVLTALRELVIKPSLELDDWSGLAALTALTSLRLDDFFPDVEVEALAGLTQLQDLELFGLRSLPVDDEEWRERLTSTLTCLVGLTRLDVSGVRLNTLEWCSVLSSLRDLSAGRNLLPSLESLPTCPQLIQLSFWNSEHLTSLSGLQSLPNLAMLNLCFCSSISSLAPLKSFPKLSQLELSSSARKLPGLKHLRGLPSLKITYR